MKQQKSFFGLLLITLVLFTGCQKNHLIDKTNYDSNNVILHDFEIADIGCLTDNVIIGKKLENPYSLSNMKKACDDLFPATKGEVPLSETLIEPNYLYVRFLPADSTDVNELIDCQYELYNYPLDYEILGDPSDYYDSSIEEGRITWQYTAVPINSELPPVHHEVIDLCYIPDGENTQNAQLISTIEDRAFDLVEDINGTEPSGSGNASSSSSSSNSRFNGTVRVKDTSLGYQGIKGVKVRARVFLKIRTAFTDEMGHYSILNDFKSSPRFELRFENQYGFQEGYSLGCLVLPATYDMKKSKNVDIEQAKSHKWWSLATINNAAYDWFKYCEINNITKPANNIRIWALTIFEGASTIMLQHGLFNYTTVSQVISFLALKSMDPTAIISDLALKALLQIIGPDITLCGIESLTSSTDIYESICHELAHATHFQQLGSSDIGRCLWWSNVFDYELAHLTSPSYGDVSYIGSGPCGVTEMWAYTMGYYMRNTTYSFTSTTFPRSGQAYWFKPDALWDLIIANDITCKQAADCLVPAVTSVDAFVNKLVENNPSKQTIIENTYAKY